jgi:hypothetical protein
MTLQVSRDMILTKTQQGSWLHEVERLKVKTTINFIISSIIDCGKWSEWHHTTWKHPGQIYHTERVDLLKETP